jgi:hypothetical protein
METRSEMKLQPSQRPADDTRKRHFFLFAAAALAFLYLRTFTLGGTPLIVTLDETLYFEHGIRILHGQVPFRDYFTYVMPGSDLLYAGVFGILGVHAWLAQAFVIFLGATIAGLLVWISSRILKGPLGFLPALLFLVMDFDITKDATHHWWCTLLVLAAVGILLGGRSLDRVAAAGILCGIGTLFTQSQGLLSLIAIGAYIIWTRDRKSRVAPQLTSLLLPFAIIIGSILAYYSYRAGFASVYFALVTFIIHNFPARTFHTPAVYFMNFPPHHKLMDVSRLIPYFLIHILVPFGYLWCLYRLFRDKAAIDRETRDAMLLINFVGLALFAAIAQAASYNRLSMIAPPATIVCVWLVRGMSATDRVILRALWAIGLLYLVALPFQLQRHWRGYLDLPTGRTAFFDPIEFEQFQWFAQHTHAGESVVGVPLYTFALSLENPTTVDYLTDTEYTTADQVEAAIRGVQLHQSPMIALFNFDLGSERYASHPGRSNFAPFLAYVRANYHLTKAFPNIEVWERN